MSLFLIPVVLISLSFSAHSSETDNFTLRYVDFESGIPAINNEVNRRIQKSIAIANQDSQCSWKSLEKAALGQLRRTSYGKLEYFANFSSLVPDMRTPISKSVYRYVPFYKNLPLQFWKLGFGRVIRSGHYLIGVDKFGHFFNQGFDYFQAKRKTHQNLLKVINIGTSSEEGFLGLYMTGIKSYADLAANFNGHTFWSQFLDPTTNATKAYVACEGSRWVQVRNFDFLDYIDGSWDEGINCNAYRSKTYAQAVSKAIQEMEDQSGRKYSCPVYPDECASLKNKYGSYASKLLHPACLKN